MRSSNHLDACYSRGFLPILRITASCSLREALQLVDIRVLDHLIVADNGCLSFAERGLL